MISHACARSRSERKGPGGEDGGRPAFPRVAGKRPGITLTEILISIMILGVGLVSLATLFPIGLLRLRDAARWSRSATLLQTSASDALARGLFSNQSFRSADMLNYQYNTLYNLNLPPWYGSAILGSLPKPLAPPIYDPLIQDTAFYGDDPLDPNNPGAYAGLGGTGTNPYTQVGLNPNGLPIMGGPGLPFAYDPLWRFQTIGPNNTPGYYLDPINHTTFEARFGYGLTTIRPDPSGGAPSAHGLQRLTNFNWPFVPSGNVQLPIMPSAMYVPNIFVSQEDVVWQETNPSGTPYTIGGVNGGLAVNGPSPVLPDLNTSGGTPSLDWRYSWMFTGQLSSASDVACFDGDIVIWENRPFAIQQVTSPPYFTPTGRFASQPYQVDGELVVEGVFGYSANVVGGYGAAADHTVLLRWPAGMPDPVVRPGDWIADVTYERRWNVVWNRFFNGTGLGLPNPTNSGEWDNLPAQRCFWYQVQKVNSPVPDATVANHRSMVVFVNQTLQARTVLGNGGAPVHLNAALIAPNVVNVIPQTIFVR